MKVSELEHGIWFGDVIIGKVDTNILTRNPMQKIRYIEYIVTWVRIEYRDGPRDENDPYDFDVILMDNNGEVCHVKNIQDLDDWEYSHCAFQRGAWQEEHKVV